MLDYGWFFASRPSSSYRRKDTLHPWAYSRFWNKYTDIETQKSLKLRNNLRIMRGSCFIKDIRIFSHHSYNTAFWSTLALSIRNINFCLVLCCSKAINKVWNIFLKCLGEVTPLEFKNNLGKFLGSKSEQLKNIEAQKKFRYSCKKRMYLGIKSRRRFSY